VNAFGLRPKTENDTRSTMPSSTSAPSRFVEPIAPRNNALFRRGCPSPRFEVGSWTVVISLTEISDYPGALPGEGGRCVPDSLTKHSVLRLM
jgi:hypothetical protein